MLTLDPGVITGSVERSYMLIEKAKYKVEQVNVVD